VSNEEAPPQEPASEPAADQLTDELVKKYAPERLLRMLGKRAGKGESLEHSVRHKYERQFGVDLGHVRVYSGEFAEEFNKQRGAYAVTVGGTGAILMGNSPDKSMASASGQALLAHELAHVAQQQRGLGGGLHRKAVVEMPFAEEHEEEAHEVEAAAHAEAQGVAAVAAAQKGQEGAGGAGKGLLEQIEKIKERVLDMMADATRAQLLRNGVVRRA
jgi:uncharacterized protein DUF4157